MSEVPVAVVSGGTGFVGSALIDLLVSRGWQVRCLTRNPASASVAKGVEAVSWSDVEEALKDARAVVHLSGSQAVGKRMTDARKQEIRDSRVNTTRSLVEAMEKQDNRPATFVCASAIGYYGDGDWGDEKTEESPVGDDFLASVCEEWEATARGAEPLGVRTVRARIGIVLGDGGPLEVMARPFKMFVGGPIAGGKQPFSWIDLRDAARALMFCVDNESLQGAVNIVGPNPTTNGESSRTMARVLKRPNLVPVPKLGLRMLFSDGADTIAGGQQVLPAVLLRAGFQFEHPQLEQVFRDHLL